MRTIVLSMVLLTASCDGADPVTDPELHRLVPCSTEWDGIWNAREACEIACEAPPPGWVVRFDDKTPIVCEARYTYDPELQLGVGFCRESSMLEIDGVRGCCDVDQSVSAIRFYVCIRDL